MILVEFILALAVAREAAIKQLVSELGSPEFGRRERATLLLRHLGPVAYPELRGAAAGEDAEVRRRAAELVRGIQLKALGRAAARQVTILEPMSTEYRVDRLIKPDGKTTVVFTALPVRFYHYLGTLVEADGKTAYVLTAHLVAVSLTNGRPVECEWGGRKCPARLVAAD
jgi:hypothetical protein